MKKAGNRMFSCIVQWLKPEYADIPGQNLSTQIRDLLNIEVGDIRKAKIFLITRNLSSQQLTLLAEEGLRDKVLHHISLDGLPELPDYRSGILVSRKPGVTDDEGLSMQRLMSDMLNIPFSGVQEVFSQEYYYLSRHILEEQLHKIAVSLLANPLINHIQAGAAPASLDYVPEVHLCDEKGRNLSVDIVLPEQDDELLQLSHHRLLALNLAEMKAIRQFYKQDQMRQLRETHGFSIHPTDTELEILAQTWSEHCKHKEFAAHILFDDLDSGDTVEIDSLFKTYIQGATRFIQENHKKTGTSWLIKVFNDNAGIVRIDQDRLFVWKVETHNSPSALDPYGGALTGIVGVNRDPLGTGTGGAKLLFNTDVLCFAPPDYDGELFPNQLPPQRIIRGVRQGIEDGGNKSGIPTINGSIVFDARYRAKPLVFCGTAAVLPGHWQGRPSWIKEISPGDLIISAGGRVGKDGIHGATVSSMELDEHSPATAVQIGSPITQKFMSDFIEAASGQGLIKCCTDNGAGGLSSSVGELALLSGGAEVDLARVPLKYPGLKPWEIFISESQERMTLAVSPEKWPQLEKLAEFYETETTCIGLFTDSGLLKVKYDDANIALLPLDFLHNQVPRKYLRARWRTPDPVSLESIPENLDHLQILRRLLRRWNICSREAVIRQYDHEVKGRTVIKPLMGPKGIAPQDAAVMRFDFSDYAGVAVSNGICPRYGDMNPYHMSAGAFDEAVRSIIAVGGRLPRLNQRDDCFWSVNDNFCVPDSVYDAKTNPDGQEKLGKLIRMCQALYDMSTYFGVPMTSGKDSMKNDARYGEKKVSVPPTVLYSMTAYIEDVRRVTTSEFKESGHIIFIIGKTRNELGASEFAEELGLKGGHVPKVHAREAMLRYEIMSVLQAEGCISSCHDLSDGGLAVALAESAFGGCMGAIIDLPDDKDLNTSEFLYSESHSRFLVSVKPCYASKIQSAFGADATLLGTVTDKPILHVSSAGRKLFEESVYKLAACWNRDQEWI